MGENQHDSPARIAKGLSSRMLGVLGTAADTRYGSQHVLGSAVTLKALKTRGLIDEQHLLTDLGRRVAYAAGAKVMLLDELHAEANADPRQLIEQVAPQSGPTSRPIADGSGGFRRGESVIVVRGDGRVWQIDGLRETLGGERFATMTHTGRSSLDTSHTAAPLDRLRHATSQPATSQIPDAEDEPLRGILRRTAEEIRALRPITATSRLTVEEFEGRISDHPLDNLRDLDVSLTTRIVQRAQYDALRHAKHVLADEVRARVRNCETAGHRHRDGAPSCWDSFSALVINAMLDDAARELGCRPVTSSDA